jgi:hypothetical protein
VLGVTHQTEVGFVFGIETDAAGDGETVVNSSTVTEERQRRKLGAIGTRSLGTKISACSRSIGDGARRSDTPI